MPNQTYTYPLVDQDNYKGRVVFRLVKVEPISTAIIARQSEQVGKYVHSQDGKTSEPASPDLANKNSGSDESQTDVSSVQRAKNYGSKVELYLPENISITDAVQYSNLDLGTLGATLEGGLQNGASIAGAAVKAMTDGVGSFAESFSTKRFDPPLARLALSRTSSKFGDQIGGAVALNTRTVINPNTRAMFESVPLRELPFTFRMIGKSKEEAEEIKNIIKFFRTELYPGTISAADNVPISLGYKIPNMFEVRFEYDGKEIATKFLDCYLRTVSVVYNSENAGFHPDGNFTDIQMSLNFTESRALTRELIVEGY